MEALDLLAVGYRIAEERQRLGYTQRDLAVKCNLGLKTISLLENGRRELKVDTLVKLSKCFGKSVDYMLFGRSADDDAILVSSYLSQIDSQITENIMDLLKGLSEKYPRI